MTANRNEYGTIRFFNFKAKTISEETAVCIIGTAHNNMLLSIGNEVVDDPVIVEHCSMHPEDKVMGLFENHNIVNQDYAIKFMKYFSEKHIMNRKHGGISLKPNTGAIIYHGRPDRETVRCYEEFLGSFYRTPLVLSADDIREEHASLQDAIWELEAKYPKIRGAIEIDA